MGISIDIHIYDAEQLVSALEKKGAKGDMLRTLMERCGHFIGAKYVLVNNEYGEYSPYYGLSTLIDSALGVDDSFGVLLNIHHDQEWCGVDVYEIAEELGFIINPD